MLTTPESIRTLQRKLYRKAKQEPTCRFHALYDKIYRADIISHAYKLVRANKGSAGIDGVTFKAIEAKEGVAAFEAALVGALKNKTYKPDPVKRVKIPKPQGGYRFLGIPTIRDRVAQMAAKLVIEPIFEADFCDTSYGFRPRRSAHDAVDEVAHALNKGYHVVIDADLSKYFDTIPHAKLMTMVAERISDGSLLHLIRLWLKAPVVEQDEDGTKRYIGGGKNNRKGTPQGGVISPLLSNLYLHLLDRIWERRQLPGRLGARMVRYADDIVILCQRGTERPMTVMQAVLRKMGLSLNRDKTRVVDARQGMLNFLGFEIGIWKSWKTGNSYAHVQPSKESLQTIKRQITEMTKRERSVIPLEQLTETVNKTVMGWVNYFQYRNCSQRMLQVRTHMEDRMRIHLRKRYKVRNRGSGFVRFRQRDLYQRYGLFKVPATGGWKRVHALR